VTVRGRILCALLLLLLAACNLSPEPTTESPNPNPSPETKPSEAESEEVSFLERPPETLRVMSFNPYWDAIFPQVRPFRPRLR